MLPATFDEIVLPFGQSLHICEFSEKDVSAVFAVESRASDFPWTEKNFLDSVRSSHICVGVKDKSVNGGAQWCAHAVFSLAGGEAELLILAVEPAYQGKKIASHLLQYMEAKLSTNAENLFLEVRASNNNAIAFYEASGFHCVGERPNYYPNGKGREDALIYAKQLFSDDMP